MVVGLVFFIRASTKDRIETLTLPSPDDPLTLLKELTDHFEARSYAVIGVAAAPERITLRGRVSPSLFLAVFLTTLAAIGALCFALVLAKLWPVYGASFLGLLGLAPVAGLFYWRGADRDEDIQLQVISCTSPENSIPDAKPQISITAHRDELIALGQALDRKN
ncbi:cofactor assembly of complex C subunit B [Nodosilinea sp. LEGE 07088]|nr:cofactor assembly of complex C subunit B [Nodosilinea sp. LEGE 07088]